MNEEIVIEELEEVSDIETFEIMQVVDTTEEINLLKDIKSNGIMTVYIIVAFMLFFISYSRWCKNG